jgi:hypothetical protein
MASSARLAAITRGAWSLRRGQAYQLRSGHGPTTCHWVPRSSRSASSSSRSGPVSSRCRAVYIQGSGTGVRPAQSGPDQAAIVPTRDAPVRRPGERLHQVEPMPWFSFVSAWLPGAAIVLHGDVSMGGARAMPASTSRLAFRGFGLVLGYAGKTDSPSRLW